MNFFKKHWLLTFVIVIVAYFLLTISPFFRLAIHPIRLLGLFDGERNYLILLQNNYELRPTGGFITAFATVKLNNGIPQEFKFEDVYGSIDEHEYVEPPSPVGELLADPSYKGHSFRDANFYPDFRKSVSSLFDFYRLTRPFQKFDGVIALDFSFFEKWFSVTGSIDAFGLTWDEDHFFENLTHLVSDIDLHNPEEAKERKLQFQSLMKTLLKKTALPWNLPQFMKIQARNADEKHLLFFFEDEALQEMVEEKGWSGEMEVKEGEDFLAVIDANYGGLKSNRYISRDIFYRIDLEAGESEVEIFLRHYGEYNIPLSGDYKGYLRVFVPKTHKPVLEEEVIVSEDPDFSVAGSVVKLPIRSEARKNFSFTFPKSNFQELSYSLFLRKQPGTDRDFYRVAVRIPSGMRIASNDFRTVENVAIFEGYLEKDRKLSLVFEKDPLPPRTILQDLVKLNEFTVMWNEPIDPESVFSRNVKIVDTNKNNSKTDELEISEISYEGNTLRVHTSGMTEQSEEHYFMQISNVSDFHGNEISEKTYTFVQRLK